MFFSVFNPRIFMSFVAILSILMSLFQGHLEALFIRMTQEQTHTHKNKSRRNVCSCDTNKCKVVNIGK